MMPDQEMRSQDVVLRDGQFPVDDDGNDNFIYWLGRVRLLTLQARAGSPSECTSAIKAALARGRSPKPYTQGGHCETIVYLVEDEGSGPVIWGYPCLRWASDAQLIVEELRELVDVVRAKFEAGLEV